SEWLKKITNILYIELPLFDPDPILSRLLKHFGWLFSAWSLLLSGGVMLAALLLLATHFDIFWSKLPSQQEFFNFKNLAYLWLALGFVKVLHEFGHGVACKKFG